MTDYPDGLTALLNGKHLSGDIHAEELYNWVYSELKRIAIRQLRREHGNHVIQPTTLVNEAWLRLGAQGGRKWEDRTHFLAFAAIAMRNILVDAARRRQTQKRASPGIEEFTDALMADPSSLDADRATVFYLDLDRALKKLHSIDPKQVQVVELRFFGGMTDEEAAEYLGVSSRTVKRIWRRAKAWLHGELKSSHLPGDPAPVIPQ